MKAPKIRLRLNMIMLRLSFAFTIGVRQKEADVFRVCKDYRG